MKDYNQYMKHLIYPTPINTSSWGFDQLYSYLD